jgi:hypothetical protein
MMRTLRPVLAALCLALAIHITACQKKTSETSSNSYSEKSTTTETSAIKVTNVDLGKNIGGDKHVTDATTSFSPNDMIYASVQTSGASPSATVKVRWTYQDGQVVDESVQTIAPTGDSATEFHISKPNGWPIGTYKAEVYLNGQLVETKEFEVKT